MRCFSGGAERYCIDLADVIKNLGYQAILIQEADQDVWYKKHNGLDILGLPYYELLSSRLSPPELAIYSGVSNFGGCVDSKRLLISHGVTWDKLEKTRDVAFIRQLLLDFDTFVSVDTNTISCLRTEFAREIITNKRCKFFYLPNYVDIDLFRPPANKKKMRLKYFSRVGCVLKGVGIYFLMRLA